jgi:hypothetical protein
MDGNRVSSGNWWFARGPTGLWFNSHELHDFIPATLLECHLQMGGLGRTGLLYFIYLFI